MAVIRTIETPPYSKATLTNVTFTEAPANDTSSYQPRFLTGDRRTIYGTSGTGLHKSVNDATTWALVATPANENTTGAWQLPNGEVLVATKVGGGKGGLHLSTGFPASDTAATWRKVITVTQNDNKVHEWWGLSYAPKGHPREGLVVATEYGGHGTASTPASGGARYVWLSLDYGRTWRTIFDLYATTQVINMHMHGVAYDPYDDRVLCTFGDGNGGQGSVSGLMACDNFTDPTPAWQSLYGPVTSATWQMTTILPMPGAVILGGDGAPPGIYRMTRTGHRQLRPPQTVLNYGGGTDTGYIGQGMFQAAPGQPVIICHEWAKNTPRAAALHVTLDGDTFTEVWRDPNLVAWSGAFCIGPTATGKVVGWLKNDARFPSGKTYMRGDLILD